MAEINALNSVKEYLSENRWKLSPENRQKLISKIIGMHRKLKKLE